MEYVGPRSLPLIFWTRDHQLRHFVRHVKLGKTLVKFVQDLARTSWSAEEFRIPSRKYLGSGGVVWSYGTKAQGDSLPSIDEGMGHAMKLRDFMEKQ